jgi:hypothetical protein
MPLFPPVVPKKLSQGRIDWRIADFRQAIFVRGQPVTWQMAAKCPCRQFARHDETRLDEDLGHSRVDCTECKGSGTLYHSSQEITALPFALSRDPEAFAKWGESVHGGAAFTTLPENRPSFKDRLTLTRTVMPYHEVRHRRATTEQPRYPIVTRDMQIASATDNTEPQDLAIGVTYVRKADSSGKVDGPELVVGTDFTVGTDGKITWLSTGSPPSLGGLYSISYYANPVYVVHDMGYSARDTFVAFKQETTAFKENVTAVTTAWLEILGVPGWPAT